MLDIDINEEIKRAQTHDEEAMENLLRIFKPKVVAISREYFLIGADFDDLLQEGMNNHVLYLQMGLRELLQVCFLEFAPN